jgi:hypothetical protein
MSLAPSLRATRTKYLSGVSSTISETGGVDRRVVHKHVRTTAVLRDEPEAFLRIEPLDRTRSHSTDPLRCSAQAHPDYLGVYSQTLSCRQTLSTSTRWGGVQLLDLRLAGAEGAAGLVLQAGDHACALTPGPGHPQPNGYAGRPVRSSARVCRIRGSAGRGLAPHHMGAGVQRVDVPT